MLDSQASSSSTHLLDHADSQTLNRPQGPGRLPSYNKRHASFDSPREIPLPSPLSPGGRDGRGYFDLPKADGREDVRKEMKEREKSRAYHHHYHHHSKESRPHHSPHSSIDRSTSPQPVFPHPRPLSLPHSSSSSSSSGNDTDTQFSTPNEHDSPSLGLGLPKPDRSSSASLPLPAQIPYHTLPRTTELPPPTRPPLAPPHSASGSFASRLPYTEDDDEDGESYMTALRRSTKSQLSSHPPVIMEESGLSRSASVGSAQAVAPPDQPLSVSTSTLVPPPSEEVWRNPPPVQPPGPRMTPSPRPVMGGVVNPSDLPPVLPPQRLRGTDPSTGNPNSRVGHGNGSGGGGGLPHTPPNPFSQTQTQTQVQTQTPPAYAPFLSPLPPPPERCWIEVETTPHAYKLNIRLEGFRRDGITLATRRRRILHVVADSWDADGGGHFERRISFGYDADLVGVRAEFDGEWLRVSVPRRTL